MPNNLQKAEITTPWGVVWIAGQGDRLSGWWFENHLHAPALQLGWKEETPKDRLVKKKATNNQVLGKKCMMRHFVLHTLQWLDQYMDKVSADLPPLHIYGFPFYVYSLDLSTKHSMGGKLGLTPNWQKSYMLNCPPQPDLTLLQPSTPHHKSDFPQLFIRSVATALAHNPLSVLLPCHRVLGTSGNLCGYAGGIDRKIALLAHEGAVLL